jgi:cob(I)alamin adenosyltransferase
MSETIDSSENINEWLRKSCPEAFFIAIRYIIPKQKEKIRCIKKIEKLEEKLENLEDGLKEEEAKLHECRARLRSWEREDRNIIPVSIKIPRLNFSFSFSIPLPSLTFINNIFDYFIKAGLSVVPFLALLSIIGGKLTITGLASSGATQDGNQPNQFILLCIIFSAVALTWMISAYICNWLLSQPEKDLKNKEIRLIQKRQILILFFIWVSEALIGLSTIPTLVGEIRLSMMPNPPIGATWEDQITLLDKIEIFIGIGLFALVNILSSLAKARRHHYVKKDKIALGRATAERNYTVDRIKDLHEEIKKIEDRIDEIDGEIEDPKFNVENIFNKSIGDLSMLYMQGRDIDGIDQSNYVDSPEASV